MIVIVVTVVIVVVVVIFVIGHIKVIKTRGWGNGRQQSRTSLSV